ncbi:MAG: Hsp33 family molecular chaperone HslO [Peptococcaceae bacterium]|nr:Hsp33 family molecular chaperone HslO [Peptococcaceae bacterium]
MSDGIIRALAYDGQVRVSAVICTDAVETARQCHDAFPTAIAALGRTMASTLLLSWGLKGEGHITLRIFGDGPLGGIIVTGDAEGNVKGYVQEPQTDLPLNSRGKLDVGGAIGTGDLYISKDIGLKEPYTGSVPLVTGEIGDDVASYLMTSEQTPSVVSVGVLVNADYTVAAAGGIILQAMPNCDEAVLDDLEARLQGARPVSTLINEGAGIADIIRNYLPGVEVQLLEENPVQWHCNCSRDRISGLLKSIGVEELEDMIENDGETEVTCHFCSTRYHFDRSELEEILAGMKEDLAKD